MWAHRFLDSLMIFLLRTEKSITSKHDIFDKVCANAETNVDSSVSNSIDNTFNFYSETFHSLLICATTLDIDEDCEEKTFTRNYETYSKHVSEQLIIQMYNSISSEMTQNVLSFEI